jgi:hypothetical protein
MRQTQSAALNSGPHAIAQCNCCGATYSQSEWDALPSRRPWPEFDIEIAECIGGAAGTRDECRSTISVEVAA